MIIASFLYVIPLAASQSLFAEGSHNKNDLKQHAHKAVKIIAMILTPAILVTIFFGKYILLAFGGNYSIEGFMLLQIFTFSGIFVSINSIFGTILKVNCEIRKMILINLLGALSILGLSHLLISKGLLGIGLAWIIGQAIVSLVYIKLTYIINGIKITVVSLFINRNSRNG